MSFMKPVLPEFDALEWAQKPFADEIDVHALRDRQPWESAGGNRAHPAAAYQR